MPIGVRAAKRGLPPIPAFGIGWLYPVCPMGNLRLAVSSPLSTLANRLGGGALRPGYDEKEQVPDGSVQPHRNRRIRCGSAGARRRYYGLRRTGAPLRGEDLPNFATDNTLFIVSDNMTAFKSTNRGQSFTQLTLPT